MGKFELHHGDCIAVMRSMADNSVDSIVTDPPYELGFMGKSWDASGIAYNVDMWREALRVLKPGGHLLAFSGTRTQHRMVCAIEDAGFEIRDQIGWVYGSGFPKSRNIAEHDLEGADSERWAGWGTALKPAWEPICVARKPLVGTVAANVLQFGTGALNIDGCRVEPTSESRERVGEASQDQRYTNAGSTNFAAKPGIRGGDPAGRWPANLIHDGSPEVVALFPESSVTGKRSDKSRTAEVSGTAWLSSNHQSTEYTDSGSAARFFYCAKASRADRNDGLIDPGPQFKRGTTLRQVENTDTKGNTHPTVKPTDLMAYLCRLVTPPGGTVLDPFAGPGSTGMACLREGFKAVLIEREAEYVADIHRRIDHVQGGDLPLFGRDPDV